jgi:site-specific recombinase XerD
LRHKDKAIGLQDLVDGFLFSLKADGRAVRTHEYYEKLLKHLLHYAKGQEWPDRADLLDTKRARQFLSWVSSRNFVYIAGHGSHRSTKSKPSTGWPYYKALRRLFNWSIEEGLLDDSPVKDIHFKAPPPPQVQPYSLYELKKFFAVCELDIQTGARFTGLRNKAILLLFIDSGLRLSEHANLKLGDLNLEQMYVRVNGKGNKVGTCPFSAKTAKAIWLYLLERKHRAKSDALWVTEEGKQFSIGGLSSAFAYLKKRSGVNSQGRVHRLRHTSALQYLRGAKDTFLLQLFLRHEDLTMSRRYTQGLKQEEAIEAHRNGASPVEGLGLG